MPNVRYQVTESWCIFWGESLGCKSDVGQLLEDAVTTAHYVYARVSSLALNVLMTESLK